jgi:septal ring factor EnvC (AmiA/AmiB activator)
MKNRKPAQLSAAEIGSNSLAKHFLEAQRLRNEIAKAELTALAEHRAARPATRVKQPRDEGSAQPSRDVVP